MKLTPAQQHEVLRLYRKGLPVKVIAGKFGVADNYPGLLARRRGLELRAPDPTRWQMRAGKLRRYRAKSEAAE